MSEGLSAARENGNHQKGGRRPSNELASLIDILAFKSKKRLPFRKEPGEKRQVEASGEKIKSLLGSEMGSQGKTRLKPI